MGISVCGDEGGGDARQQIGRGPSSSRIHSGRGAKVAIWSVSGRANMKLQMLIRAMREIVHRLQTILQGAGESPQSTQSAVADADANADHADLLACVECRNNPMLTSTNNVVAKKESKKFDENEEEKADLLIVISDSCTGDRIPGVSVSWAGSRKTTASDGQCTFADTLIGKGTIKCSKTFLVGYKIITHYPQTRFKTERKYEYSVEYTTAPGQNSKSLETSVPRVASEIKFQRIFPLGSGDSYGHWWVELPGGESYGWWPKKPLSTPRRPEPEAPNDDAPWYEWVQYRADMALHSATTNMYAQTLSGVEGELNGQTSFGGTTTRDPHHGDPPDVSYSPIIEDCTSDEVLVSIIRNAVSHFDDSNDSWSWRFEFGIHCHTLNIDLMDAIGVNIYAEN